MENIASFFGGVIALAILGLLLFFELGRESVLLVYAIYALIILVAGTMVITMRSSIFAFIRSLRGNAIRKPRPSEPETDDGRKIERFFGAPAGKGKDSEQVNPMLKRMADSLGQGKQRKSRFSGLVKKLRGIRMPRIGRPKPARPGPAMKKGEPPGQKVAAKPGPTPNLEDSLEESLEKIKTRAKAGKTTGQAGSCQICGKSPVQPHYIVPLDKGGRKEKGNTIILCKTHKEQAEKGMYSENLLKKLKG